MTAQRRIGVCYYPEHWPEEMWARDAARMRNLGISQVRIGEFAWSRIEPRPGEFRWEWLDRAIDTLGGAGLGVMLGTPTATPPKWLVDAHPDILAWDRQGKPRRFGSRRHYCFSSAVYREECQRIVAALAQRYGHHGAVSTWQTDNEYGCHDTVRSYSPEAARAFRIWLAARYGEIAKLNAAWGGVFWSQEYRNFDEVDLPNLTVTEANPAHWFDFFRFSSDQVISFNRLQTDILREHSPGREIIHNVMGFFFDFDHHTLASDLDGLGWDSYPLGFLDVGPFPPEDKKRFMRQGHPDIAAFHHDLYRGCGRFQVIEQQPGPVNWARHNPAPLSGMARLWAAEAFAHGAEAVSYFRWRQAPSAQEQMHAGLEYPDGSPAPASAEAKAAAADIAQLEKQKTRRGDVALLFSYEAAWAFEALPHGETWSFPALCFEWYSALRRLGLDVDILPPEADFSDYGLTLAPSLPILCDTLVDRLSNTSGLVLVGPRTGSKTEKLQTPEMLAPGPLRRVMPLRIPYAESFPSDYQVKGRFGGAAVSGRAWLDHVETDLAALAEGPDGGFLYRHGNVHYLATVPQPDFLAQLFGALASEAGLSTTPMPEGLRKRRLGDLTCIFNYDATPIALPDYLSPADQQFLTGGRRLDPAGFAILKSEKHQ